MFIHGDVQIASRSPPLQPLGMPLLGYSVRDDIAGDLVEAVEPHALRSGIPP